MRLIIIFTTLIFFASFNVYAKGQLSLGLGYQHASVFGVQYGYIDGNNKYFGAVGLTGAALGYQRAIDFDSKHTIGIVVGKESLASEDGFALLTYNYHFTAQEMSGWQLGVSAGVRREDEASFFGSSGEASSKAAFSIDLSYKF